LDFTPNFCDHYTDYLTYTGFSGIEFAPGAVSVEPEIFLKIRERLHLSQIKWMWEDNAPHHANSSD